MRFGDGPITPARSSVPGGDKKEWLNNPSPRKQGSDRIDGIDTASCKSGEANVCVSWLSVKKEVVRTTTRPSVSHVGSQQKNCGIKRLLSAVMLVAASSFTKEG